MNPSELLESTMSEYRALLPTRGEERSEPLEHDRLVAQLCSGHDWTEQGARAIVSLASDYGAFMLRNALALATILDKEDGDLRF